MHLAYAHRHQLTISVGLTGCQTVTNGNLNRTAADLYGTHPTGPKLLKQLRALT